MRQLSGTTPSPEYAQSIGFCSVRNHCGIQTEIPVKRVDKKRGTERHYPALTDTPFFGGSLHDIAIARPLTKRPILRKDFIIDEYQLYQTRIIGADAVLLIAAALTPKKCRALAAKAHELELEVLLEIHREEELDYINENIDMIGINNRNLGSFHTDVENSFRLIGKLPREMVKVSESGISDPEKIKALHDVGFDGFLIGETFMKTENPGDTLQQFIRKLI